MRLYRSKKQHRGLLVSALIFIAVILLFQYGFKNISGTNSAEDLNVTQEAIRKAVVSCYAIEGVYPPSVSYLEQHYGVVINHNRYSVSYELAGSNIMPSIDVREKGQDQGVAQ